MECSSRSSEGRVVPISASTSSLWAFDAEAEARASHEIEAVVWCEAGVTSSIEVRSWKFEARGLGCLVGLSSRQAGWQLRGEEKAL